MADTYGLMKTRQEWQTAVENGETNLTHADWYEKKKQQEAVIGKETARPTLAELSLK